eukprot:TRINITY_DN11072_c0_g1_i1.p1 TRINITY_DN11072_c0_g1~~TRINITY_DN11072_c0_g1_i1.p1  ORF type:complete len:168 (+),score=46.95 TRINITY_DN11072_c0_g1_i1:198-701(+)
MDYSFLLGIHNPKRKNEHILKSKPSRASLYLGNQPEESSMPALMLAISCTDETAPELPPVHFFSYPSVFNTFEGGYQATDENDDPSDEVYYFGIIDILVEYDVKKKIEHQYKSKVYEDQEISSVDPITYANRFKRFISTKVLGNPERATVDVSTLRKRISGNDRGSV